MSKVKSRKAIPIMILVIFGCAIMAIVESVIQPGYLIKSVIKVSVFLSCLIIFRKSNQLNITFFKIDAKKDLLISLIVGISVFLIVMVGYFLFKNTIDFDAILNNLTEKEGITKNNYLIVFGYISLINSLIEEIFFRGLAFIELKKHISNFYAYSFSAICFALYHIFIINTWFTFPILLLLLISLTIGGIIFNYFDSKGSIYHSWIIHLCANLAINTIGIIIFIG